MSTERTQWALNKDEEYRPEPIDPIREIKERTVPSGEKILLSEGAWLVLRSIRRGGGRKSISDIAGSITYADGTLPVALLNTFLRELKDKLNDTGTSIIANNTISDPTRRFLRIVTRKKRTKAGK